MSNCNAKCVVDWPPFLADANAKPEGDWALVDVKDKDGQTKKMWAYGGWPLYRYGKDQKPGDVNGNGIGGAWRVAKPGN